MLEVETSLSEQLEKHFGFKGFKGEQEAIINNVLSGRHTFVIMPTGGGKSLCYQLPALISEGTAIIISPLIALMKNQVDSIRSFGTDDGIAHFMNSSLSKTEITKVKKDITEGRTKMLYVAPESLAKQDNADFLREVNISFVAIDEAHCISEWGHDFRPEYRRLRPIIDTLGNVPIIALTATATEKVQQDIQKNLGMNDAVVFKSSFNRANLYYEVRPKTKDVIKDIIRFIKQHPGKSGIVYCLSRKKVEELAETLVVNGIKALPYHAGLDAPVRSSHQDKFLMEEVDVIVATIAFGMGIDKPDVRFVVHHDIPKSLESYYQETGRAGRDGGEGRCICYYSYDDIQKLEKFMKGKPISEQEIGKQLLLETVSYAETSACRRKFILHYFGEQYDDEKCRESKMCDNCVHPKEKFEGKDEMVLLLKAVEAVKEKFKAKHVVNVLTGSLTNAVKSYKHDTLDVFGKGDERDEKFWNAVVRQALLAKFLYKDIENYGLLKLDKKGREFIEKPYSFMLTKDHDYDKQQDDNEDIEGPQKSGGGGGADEALFKMLKDLRKKIAKQQNLPPYVIFQDPSLEEMAINYPIKMDELTQITGVGHGKALKFGKPFIDLIKEYVEENEIERPVDMVVKSVVNKSGLKVYIIQNVDRQRDLEDIADSKGIDFYDLLIEMERIVTSGTKLNIKYFIEEVIDEDKQDEIIEYFRESESPSVEAALEELGEDDYSEEEIRLVKIQFLSDFGN